MIGKHNGGTLRAIKYLEAITILGRIRLIDLS